MQSRTSRVAVNGENEAEALKLPRTAMVAVASVGFLSVISTAGCSGANTGEQSNVSTSRIAHAGEALDVARAQLSKMPGISESSIKVDRTVTGLQTNRRIWIEATSDSTSRDEQARQVEQLFRLGWSVNDVDANKGVSVRMHTSPQVIVGDLLDSSWTDREFRSSPGSFRALVVVPRSSLESKLGKWPGDVPDLES
ncbi:hypothetical protein [Curtobacterium sp. 9128]|uniref:hypothetical protein n=1 Tax=Curtobacterium sp. 9128 TaxID=1793722 RepID=UPI0024819B1F|nr:hypothetical protein [Curtobacterium sp. 9128]